MRVRIVRYRGFSPGGSCLATTLYLYSTRTWERGLGATGCLSASANPFILRACGSRSKKKPLHRCLPLHSTRVWEPRFGRGRHCHGCGSPMWLWANDLERARETATSSYVRARATLSRIGADGIPAVGVESWVVVGGVVVETPAVGHPQTTTHPFRDTHVACFNTPYRG